MQHVVANIRGPRTLPRSVVVLVALHAAAALLFGILAIVDSSAQFPDLVTNDDGTFAVGLYANRNLGVGLALAGALALHNGHMLIALFAVRFVTDLADLLTALTTGLDGGEIAGQAIFFGLLFASEIHVIRVLLRRLEVQQ